MDKAAAKIKAAIIALNVAISVALRNFRPPENITVSRWAEQKRILSRETSAEPGPWRNSRTPYLVAPMDAFTDPRVRGIVVVAPSQTGKSELELNILGYIIDQDPGSILFIHPDLTEAKKFSRVRLDPMFRDNRALSKKLRDISVKDSASTILQKSFPGGILTMVGTRKPDDLASIPSRYILGDERDRWELSAGDEGDPMKLAMARQTTFYNAKFVDISSPTIKGSSRIVDAYNKGTQEKWCHQCPDCGEWHEIVFDDIKADFETRKVNGSKSFNIKSVGWVCPSCKCWHDEETMRVQPQEWIADNPEALHETGIKSLWFSAFSSPWKSWTSIFREFLEAGKDPLKLQPFFNTTLGKPWEDRGDLPDEERLMDRLEEYGAELPEGVLALTCAVDTQDNRLEYEVVGWGHFAESWGIRKGIIMGRPDNPEVWDRLDDVVDHVYRFSDDMGLKISVTFVDSGGHYTQEVYRQCRARLNKKVFAIKGKGGDSVPLVSKPSQVDIVINERRVGKCWLYTLGVDAGKAATMSALRVQEKGPNYCHFPREDKHERGYNLEYFRGLLSERLTLVETRKGNKWEWQRIPGHTANEALDVRNYNLAGFKMMAPDTHALERRLRDMPEPERKRPPPQRRRRSSRRDDFLSDW